MYEVEIKVRAPHDQVRAKLEDAGIEPVEHATETDTYYDAPHRTFGETDEALRVRRRSSPEGDDLDARLTYKGPLIDERSKTREEFETEIESPDAVANALDALDFSPAATVEKERERFAIEGYTLTLDTVAGIGEFVEIEREVEQEARVEAAREGAADRLRDLDLDPEEQTRTSYLELVLGARE